MSVPASIRNSRAVRAWLKTQSEFTLSDFAEQHTAWNRWWRLENQHFIAAIEAVKDELPLEDREVAELFLLMPPRKMALKLGVSRKRIYKLVQRAKERAMKLYHDKQLTRSTRTGEVIQAAPIRIVEFGTPAAKREARLVLREGEAVWIDAAGAVFDEEVQDLLNHLEELQGSFEVMDVE